MYAPVKRQNFRLFDTGLKADEKLSALVLCSEYYQHQEIFVLAIGGSVNTVRHLSAIATEAEIDMDVVKNYEKFADTIHLLTAVRPNGPYRTEDLEAAGGCRAVMKCLEKYLHLDAMTVSGNTVGENIKDAAGRIVGIDVYGSGKGNGCYRIGCSCPFV